MASETRWTGCKLAQSKSQLVGFLWRPGVISQMPDASATTWMDGLELKLGTGKRRRGRPNNIPAGSHDNVGCLEMRLVGYHSQQAARTRW